MAVRLSIKNKRLQKQILQKLAPLKVKNDVTRDKADLKRL